MAIWMGNRGECYYRKFLNSHAASIYIDQLTQLSSLNPPACHLVASGASNDVSVVVAGAFPDTEGVDCLQRRKVETR